MQNEILKGVCRHAVVILLEYCLQNTVRLLSFRMQSAAIPCDDASLESPRPVSSGEGGTTFKTFTEFFELEVCTYSDILIDERQKGGISMFHENQIVFLEDTFSSKDEVIHHLTHRENSAVRDANQYESDVLEREASFATYTIDGVAMPHAKSEGVSTPFVAFARLKTPVRWGQRRAKMPAWSFSSGCQRSAVQQTTIYT